MIYSAEFPNKRTIKEHYQEMFDNGLLSDKYIGVNSITFDTNSRKVDYYTSNVSTNSISFESICNMIQRYKYDEDDATHEDCASDPYKLIDNKWCMYDYDVCHYVVTDMSSDNLTEIKKETKPELEYKLHYNYTEALKKIQNGDDVDYYCVHSDLWLNARELSLGFITDKTLFRDTPPELPATTELINGVEIPRPITIDEAAKLSDVYVVSLASHKMFTHFITGTITFPSMNILCERNIVHATEENAIEHAKALLLISRG